MHSLLLALCVSTSLLASLPPSSAGVSPAAPLEIGVQITKAARAAGVRIATGSDHPGDGRVPGVHLEYALLLEQAEFEPLYVIKRGVLYWGANLRDAKAPVEVLESIPSSR